MIVAAALVPGPPLLVEELSGADPDAAALRAACRTAVGDLLAAGPAAVVVVGAAERSASWPPDARLDLARYGTVAARSHRDSARPGLPLSLGMGAWLLDTVGYGGHRELRAVAADATSTQCHALGAELRAAPGRIGLLVVADGSARRTPKAPGHLDERAEPYDASVTRAVRDGDLAALAALDPGLAGELMAGGWPALQVLTAALPSPVGSTVHYDAAPFGVGYLVATLRLAG